MRTALLSAIGLFALAAYACGGSADSQSGPNEQALITDLCKKMGTAPMCGSPQYEQKCLSDLATDQADAKQEGCQSALDQYLSCANSHPINCVSDETSPLQPIVDSACSELLIAFDNCYTHLPGECAIGVGSGSCKLKCTGLSSSCQGPDPNGPVDCVCDTGPKTGTTFQATDCGKNLGWATGHQCQ